MFNDSWETRITWTDELATGNEIIDEQHKIIINITNAFIDACLKNESKKILGEMIDYLIWYTADHFGCEEKLMLEYDYPEYDKNKQLHEEFTNTVNEFKKEFDENGESDELNKSLSGTIVRWLVGHIKYEDVKVANHVRKEKQRRLK